MNILVVGNGGREHALAWKLAQSPKADTVFVAPGNAGTALEPNLVNVDIASDDIQGLVSWAKQEHIDLTVIGPEAPLVAGIVDAFQAQGLACFGPSANAARLEGSKQYSKEFMTRHHIPTAVFAGFTDVDKACAYLDRQQFPLVIKADGLAAGKGVVIAETREEAEAAITDMLANNRFGEAGSRVVIEEFLVGEEASFIVMSDGNSVLPMATSQDHKARDEGDKGPNTGGMGAYSPAPVVTPEIYQTVMNTVIEPTIAGMRADGAPFVGFLYAGLMIGADSTPKVLEYNVRFGDPETQPIMLRLRSDLAAMCMAAIEGTLDSVEADWDERASLGVVMAAGGYPAHYHSGDVISSIPAETPDSKVFHAGTRLDGDKVVTSGGRVLCACALGEDIKTAQQHAYELVDMIDWQDVYVRRDIGFKGI
jgi:phosphoribosylamine---glycine ligase